MTSITLVSVINHYHGLDLFWKPWNLRSSSEDIQVKIFKSYYYYSDVWIKEVKIRRIRKLMQDINMIMIYYWHKRNGSHLEYVW